MKDLSVVVFGAGRFGTALAEELFENDVEVMIIDNNEDKIQSIVEKVTTGLVVDMMDMDAVEELGLRNFEVAVIATGNLEASIVATVAAKEHGIPLVYAKAISEMHGRILKKVGADQIIYPEREIGQRLARSISGSNIIEYIHFSDEYSIAEVATPAKWKEKTILELDVRKNYDLNIIAIKKHNRTIIAPNPRELIEKDDIIIMVGENKSLEKVLNHA